MPDEDERIVDRRAAARMKGDADEVASDEQPETPAEATGDETLESLKERADRMYANWQRSAADFINYKRRMEEDARKRRASRMRHW